MFLEVPPFRCSLHGVSPPKLVLWPCRTIADRVDSFQRTMLAIPKMAGRRNWFCNRFYYINRQWA